MPGITELLDREWEQLATSARGRRRLRRWAATYPALDGLEDLHGVLARRCEPEQSQPVLAALAELAPKDVMAARTLLAALMPGIVRLASAEQRGPIVFDDMVGTAWMLIRTYPPQRAGSVAGNILLDVRKRYRSDDRAFESLRDEMPEACDDRTAPSAEDEALANLGLERIVSYLRKKNVDEHTIDLLLRTRAADEPLTAYAARSDLRYRTLLMRRFRVEQKLRDVELPG
jgi:hypothetical protein